MISRSKLIIAIALLTTLSSTARAYTLYVSTTGSDTNSGTSASAPLATLAQAQTLLFAVAPQENVYIKIAPGVYRCNDVGWTYYNENYLTFILPQQAVPSPATSSYDDPNRPVFYGKAADGSTCARSTWMTVSHGHVRMRLVIKGLTISLYRGGISIRNVNTTTTNVDQDITIDNMYFLRIGDYYYSGAGAGKGAILLQRTFGNTFKNSYFKYLTNIDENAGLIHGIYFAHKSSRNTIYNNYFHSFSGTAIKLTDYSNDNSFTENSFSYIYTTYAVIDRWCGSLSTDDILHECGGAPECPSWNTYFPMEQNYFSNLSGAKLKISEIPAGQTCEIAPPTSNLRANLGSGGTVYGSDGIIIP